MAIAEKDTSEISKAVEYGKPSKAIKLVTATQDEYFGWP